MAKPITPEELSEVSRDMWNKAVNEILEIHALGLDDLLPDAPLDNNDYEAWQEWKRQQNRGPATLAGLIEAYRRGYFVGMGESASGFADRDKELEDAIQKAVARLQDYADMTVDQWGETVADGGITAWMVIRQELRTVVAGSLARALLRETE